MERAVLTKFRFIEQLLKAILIIATTASILTNFNNVKNFGISILASAGFLTAVVLFASQKFIASFLAGLQIAFTHPIKLNDIVIIENEFGQIEKIKMSYIVVRLWDKRCIILPVTYFLETPFQNWTYNTSELIGSVFLFVDHQCNLNKLRNKLDAIVENNLLWDKKTKALQLTDCKERTMEIRILISSYDAQALFDLRRQIREEMIHYIQKQYPNALPHQRHYFNFKDF